MPAKQKVSDDQIKETMELRLTNAKSAELLGITRQSYEERKKRLASRGYSPEHNWKVEVPEGYYIKGVSSYCDAEGNVLRQWVKSDKDKEQQIELIKEACLSFLNDLPKLKPIKSSQINYNKDTLAVYPLGDPHIGMLAWEQETDENWDLKIAEQIFCEVFDRAVKAAPSSEQALIINLGDYFHYDNLAGVTSRSGNKLDIDGRYAKMIQVGVKIMRQMITSALEHHKTVRVITAIGNHDDISAMWLALFLQHVYDNEPRVIIDSLPAPFHYHVFGSNLIGVHHGHTCKMNNLPMVMATDKAKDWGNTTYRYWYTGHIHHDSLIDSGGCKVESFRTLAAKDLYSHSGGYRSGRDTKVIVLHKDRGEIERHTIQIPDLKGIIE